MAEQTTSRALVLCDISNAQSTYVADCTDTSLWNDKFITALSIRLAMNICGTLCKPEVAAKSSEQLAQMYAAALPGERYSEEGWISDTKSGEASRLVVYNMALRLVGARMVSSIWEDMPEAVQCGVYWDRARRSVLRDYPYRFAQRRIRLTERKMPDVYSMEWRNCYVLPDALKITRVHGGNEGDAYEHYTIAHDDNGEFILCNMSPAFATVTVDVEDTEKWDELFCEAMSRKLAFYISPVLQRDNARTGELAAFYAEAVPHSEGHSGSEGRDSKLSMDTWLAARCS